MERAAAEAAHMSAPDHALHQSRRFLLLLKGRPHMSQSFGVYGSLSLRAVSAPPNRRWPMILNALVEKLKRRSKDDFKGRHYEGNADPAGGLLVSALPAQLSRHRTALARSR